MKALFNKGDTKTYRTTVQESDTASFHGQQVHPVCATFALARDIEWASRLFVLEMKEDGEEGIGTMLSIEHFAPAFVGEEVAITATIESLEGNSIVCTYQAKVGDRTVATGRTGQKVLPREKIDAVFNKIRNGKR
ncbi:thioesterase family protein [Roseivirga sp. BDSF3-8]|uniref:thioesterase family protein n=1 Tax=Roseivirga sp. BDSF3-8 TaxID=3241598 RepID=UPI003531ABAB